MRNCRFVYVLAGLMLATTGCGSLVVESNPDTFRVAADAASELRGPQSVALNNAYQAAKQETIHPGGAAWIGDLKQYTDTAITMLGREMQKKGVNVASPAAKSVTLRVHSVQAALTNVTTLTVFTATIRSSLVLEAEYGDGTKSSIRTESSSPVDASRAVSGALMFAVSRLLRDEQFLAYVNR